MFTVVGLTYFVPNRRKTALIGFYEDPQENAALFLAVRNVSCYSADRPSANFEKN